MSNEYDYSGLYNNTSGSGQPNGQNPQPEQSAPAQNQQPQQSSYPNVGSSGANTANTARTDYSSYNSGNSGSTSGQNPQQDSNGYTSSFSGGNGNNGGYNGYSYSSAPQQPPVPQKKKGSKVLLRVLACVGVAALGFGGGLGGAVVASRAGLTGNQVVVQQVERSTDATAAGSTDGTSMSVQQIASVVSPSVVAITTEQMSSSQTWFGGYYVQSGAGSGVIISQDGYILTCAHVVSGATSVKVQLNGSDESYDATVVGQDSTSDIAVLKIDATGLTPAVIGDSDALAVGEVAVAVGNPLGTLSNTVTDGIVSALNRQVTVQDNDMTLIQTDASISPGNSGGGLFNANGELIGIVNAKSSYSEAEGIGFAIPIDDVMGIISDLIDYGYVTGAYMGITVKDNDKEAAAQFGLPTDGAYVVDVTPGSSADKAGIQSKDLITAVDDHKITTRTDLTRALRNYKAGDTAQITVVRSGRELTLTITFDEKPHSTTVETAPQEDSSMPSEGDYNDWYEYFRRFFGG